MNNAPPLTDFDHEEEDDMGLYVRIAYLHMVSLN